MHTIYLVRHGQKEYHAGDPPLTEKGRKQAAKTGEYLKQFPIQVVLSSPSRRTKETAEIIANVLHLPVTQDERLRERIDWSGTDGETFEEFLIRWTYASWNRNAQLKNGESSRSAGERIEEIMQEVTGKETHHVLFVSHGGVIADFLRNIVGDEAIESIITEFPLGKDHDIKECSVSILEIEGKTFNLRQLAFADHLDQIL